MINAPTPITIPATTSKVYDKKWILGVTINAPSTTQASCFIHLCPQCSADGSILPSQVQNILVSDIFGAMAAVDKNNQPTAQAAAMTTVFGAILAAVQILVDEQATS